MKMINRFITLTIFFKQFFFPTNRIVSHFEAIK